MKNINKDLFLKILSIACAALFIVTLILSVCLIHSCQSADDTVECKHDDDDYLYIGNYRGNDDDDDTVDLNDEWYDLDLPETSQSVSLKVYKLTDKFEMRIANHSEYADSKATINGKVITYDGNEMDIFASWYSEYNNQYECQYEIRGNNLYATPICITPPAQETEGQYHYSTDLVNLGARLTSADEIQFDGNNGITLRGISGDFVFTVVPVRGGPIEFAYTEFLGIKGTVNEPADITLTWDEEGLIVRSSEDLQGLGATTDRTFYTDHMTVSDEVKNEYKVTFTKEDYSYSIEID